MKTSENPKHALGILGIAFFFDIGLAFVISYSVGYESEGASIFRYMLIYLAIPIGIAGIPPTIATLRKVEFTQTLTPFITIALLGFVVILMIVVLGIHLGVGAFYFGLVFKIVVAVWILMKWVTEPKRT